MQAMSPVSLKADRIDASVGAAAAGAFHQDVIGVAVFIVDEFGSARFRQADSQGKSVRVWYSWKLKSPQPGRHFTACAKVNGIEWGSKESRRIAVGEGGNFVFREPLGLSPFRPEFAQHLRTDPTRFTG